LLRGADRLPVQQHRGRGDLRGAGGGQDAFFGDEKNPKTASAAENDHDWKILEWELTAPPQARRILVWLSAHYPGKVTFDHVAVYRK
jgi:hypothetical protein